MPIYVIIEIQGKLAPAWQDISLNENNTTSSWNINRERQTEQTSSPDDLIMKDQTQIMKKFWFGQTSTFANDTHQSESSISTIFTTIGTAKSSKCNTNSNQTSRNGHQHIISPY